jgi:hypothetical protein
MVFEVTVIPVGGDSHTSDELGDVPVDGKTARARRARVRPGVRPGPRSFAGAALAALFLAGATASAGTMLTGFAGAAFGGATQRTRGSYGGAIGFLGEGPLGFEVEFGVTPEFFGRSEGLVFTSNDVVTGMGSLLLATPGRVRIYGAAGAGVMRTRIESSGELLHVDSNDFGIDAGGGLLLGLGEHVSLRGDVRYFRDLQNDQAGGELDLDLGHVDYWRAAFGLTLRF